MQCTQCTKTGTPGHLDARYALSIIFVLTFIFTILFSIILSQNSQLQFNIQQS